MVNRYAGKCYYCGQAVPSGEGYVWKGRGRGWNVAHCGCRPGAGGRSLNEVREEIAANSKAWYSNMHPVSNVINVGGKDYYQNTNGRCEDAPCCGCCTI